MSHISNGRRKIVVKWRSACLKLILNVGARWLSAMLLSEAIGVARILELLDLRM